MTNTETAPRPATSQLDDAALLDLVIHQRNAAQRRVDQYTEKLKVRSLAYVARWNMADAVAAETEVEILSAAIMAAERNLLRQMLAHRIAGALNTGTRSTDPFDRAVSEVEKEVGARLLRTYGAEIDMDTFLGRI